MKIVCIKPQRIMTKQDAFNKVWNHFIKNKKGPSISKNGQCEYYNNDTGKKCAIGVLLPKSVCVEICNNVISIARHEIPEKYREPFFSDILFWSTLQMTHDQAAAGSRPFKPKMKECLQKFAKEWKLEIP
ncbi:MAG: hypothetical protein AABY07_00890 [Nanoarchaeota archaeon]